MSRALDAKPETTNARADYYARIGKHNMAPLWEVLHKLLAKEPVTQATPHVWKYREVRKALLESAEIISAEEAERRVLVLENPSLRDKSCITEALYAGLQLIMPGEIAPTHRHSPAALRFIIEGSRAFTAINGEKAYMEPGDLILTPSWVWHDHGHEGEVPVVWLDGLDIPMVRYMGPVFAEGYPEGDGYYPRTYAAGDNQARYGANMLPLGATFATQNSPVFHYPYAQTRAALERLAKAKDVDPYHGIKMEYINPATGGPAMPTIGTYMQHLPKGFSGETYRSTAAWVYAVADGEGRTVVGDRTIDWRKQDVFVIPAWYQHRHEASSDSFLFSFSDKPVHDKLGWFREVRGNA
jgi:gentisate 1,2-dioxygenase